MRNAAIVLPALAAIALAGCGGSHRQPTSGLTRPEQTDLGSRLVLREDTGVTVRPNGPIVATSSAAAFLSHRNVVRGVWERPPDPAREAAALRTDRFVSAAGEALVDPAVNVHSDAIQLGSAIEAQHALRRIDALDFGPCPARASRCGPVARFRIAAIPGSRATVRSGTVAGIGPARAYRVLFTDGSFLYGEQIESVPSPEVRGKFVAWSTRLYLSVRGKLGP